MGNYIHVYVVVLFYFISIHYHTQKQKTKNYLGKKVTYNLYMNPSTVHNFKGEINIIKKIQFLFGQAVAEVAGRREAKYHLFILNMLS